MQMDHLLETIANYVTEEKTFSQEAMDTARLVLIDSLGCGILALKYPECAKHLGPLVPDTIVLNGARVPGTSFQLDPVQAAFNIGCMNRWLDYNDTWLAAEWGHPSDNLGGILAMCDYISRKRRTEGKSPITMDEVLEALIKAHEIQGILSLENCLNRVGLDHVLFVKVASSAVVTGLMGGTKEEIVNAVSNAWVDNASLRTYRHAPNAGSRKSWAAGDATSRAVRLALMALKGEMGYPQALSAPKWGFQDVLMEGRELVLPRELGSYVMENILFKISYPAEFHAQTAAECAIILQPFVNGRLDEIDRIVITTQESAIRIIDKTGPLHNPADRDHCIQYITAVGLIYGELTADHYEPDVAANPLIDQVREKMQVVEDEQYSRDYLDPEKRTIANAVQVFFKDGTSTEKIEVIYPLGHRRRRAEGVPLLYKKFEENLRTRFPSKQSERILQMCRDTEILSNIAVDEFMNEFVM